MPKGSTLKKPKTLNNNKKSNKFDLKKNWKKTAFIGMAGFLFFLSVGYGGLLYIQNSNSASAENWTYITRTGSFLVQACRMERSTDWYARLRFYRDGFSTKYLYNAANGTIFWSSATTHSPYSVVIRNGNANSRGRSVGMTYMETSKINTNSNVFFSISVPYSIAAC